MRIFLYFSFLSLFFGCSKNEVVEIRRPTLPDYTIPDSIIQWKIPLLPDTSGSISFHPILTEYGLIYAMDPDDPLEKEVVRCVDHNGEENWSWSDQFPVGQHQDLAQTFRKDDFLVFGRSHNTYCVDIKTGATAWRYYNPEGDIQVYQSEHFVIKPLNYGALANQSDSAKLMISEVSAGDFHEAVSIPKTDKFHPFIPGAISYIHPEGDTIMAFYASQYHLSPFRQKTDVYAFNITADTLVWKIDSITPFGGSNIRGPQMDGDVMFVPGQYDIFAVDKWTGEQMWASDFPHDFQGSNFLIYQDLIITNLDNGDLIAISKFDGSIQWHQKHLTACCTELRIYQDKLYLANGKLFIINPLNGEVLFEYRSSTAREQGRGNASFLRAVSVDTVRNLMYTTDIYYLLCMELPNL